MQYTIYKTTNVLNGKIYIGCHITSDPYDNYLGSGTILKRAISAHGRDNFIKEVLHIFDNIDDMLAKEAELVDTDFVNRDDTYNIKIGGQGGWDYINRNGIRPDPLVARLCQINKRDREHHVRLGQHAFQSKLGIFDPKNKQAVENGRLKANASWIGRRHSDETKRKIGEANKSLTGSRNGSFGTCWITNGVHSMRIPLEDVSKWDGYRRGRVIKKRT